MTKAFSFPLYSRSLSMPPNRVFRFFTLPRLIYFKTHRHIDPRREQNNFVAWLLLCKCSRWRETKESLKSENFVLFLEHAWEWSRKQLSHILYLIIKASNTQRFLQNCPCENSSADRNSFARVARCFIKREQLVMQLKATMLRDFWVPMLRAFVLLLSHFEAEWCEKQRLCKKKLETTK